MPEPDSSRRWGVSPVWAAALLILAVGLGTWSVLATTRDDTVAAGGAAAVFAAAALAAWRFRTRLIADATGLTVRRLFSSLHQPWTAVATVSAPTLRRRGLISTALEIEFTDDTLVLLRRTELGTDPEDVRAALLALLAQRSR